MISLRPIDYSLPFFRRPESIGVVRRLANTNIDKNLVLVMPGVIPGDLIEELVSEPNWLDQFVAGFADGEEWWYRTPANKDELQGTREVLAALGTRAHNLLFAKSVRPFKTDQRDLRTGSAEWLNELRERSSNGPVNAVLELLSNFFNEALKVGITIYLEKIAGVVCLHRESYVTLTPQLHRDGDYGLLASGIITLYPESRFPFASTVFVPEINLDALKIPKPVTADKLQELQHQLVGYVCPPGALAIYSGKMSSGKRDDNHGALHISPEGFVPTERISFLVRLCYTQ